MALVENYLDKGHHVFADRLYSSVPLVNELDRQGTGYTGTLIRSRQQLPRAVRGAHFKMNKGETQAWRDGKKLVLAWRDKGKPTAMISTVCSSCMTTVRSRRGNRVKPLVIDQYNQSMGGVDKADQYSCYYSFGRKSIKWWRKLMFWLLEVSIVNAYILYKGTVPSDSLLSHVNFRRQLVVSLCQGVPLGDVRRQLMLPSRSEERFHGRHYSDNGDTRRDYCKTCTDRPPLHNGNCFERYHELLNYRRQCNNRKTFLLCVYLESLSTMYQSKLDTPTCSILEKLAYLPFNR
jgi:hypothetical protein